MSNQIIKVTKHATLAEAVKASGMDLSYNPASAAQKIKDIEAGYNRDAKPTEFFVSTETNRVFYIFECDIRILNEFEPFHSMMDDLPFKPVIISDGEIEIMSDVKIPRTAKGRKLIRKADWIATTL